MLNADTLRLLAGAAEKVSADMGGHPDYIRAAHDARHEAQSANGMGTHATFKLDILLDSSREHQGAVQAMVDNAGSDAEAAKLLKNYVEVHLPSNVSYIAQELITAGFEQIDWHKLADHWRED